MASKQQKFDLMPFVAPFFLIVLSVIVFSWSFSASLRHLHHLWSANNESYSHGYLLLCVSAYLLWRVWPSIAFKPSWLGIVCAFICMLLWLLGDATQVMTLQLALLPLLLFFALTSITGWRASSALIVPLGILYLALPLADVLIVPLQQLTTMVTELLLRLLGITAFVEGFRISFPNGTMEIIGGCAGLNYLLSALCLGVLYAHLHFQKPINKCIAIALAVLVALLGNWVRVGSLVLIGYYTDMQSPLVNEHGLYGWLIFAGFVLVYLLILSRIKDAVPVAPKHERVTWPYSRLLFVTLLVCSFPLLLKLQRPQFDDVRLMAAQQHLGMLDEVYWQAQTQAQWQPNFKGADLVTHWRANHAGHALELSVFNYLSQHQGKELINYRNRLIRQRELVAHDVWQGDTLKLNVSQIDGRTQSRLVWWFYQVGDEVSLNDFDTKLAQARQVLSAPEARLVSLSLRCQRQRCENIKAQLQQDAQFVAQLKALPMISKVQL